MKWERRRSGPRQWGLRILTSTSLYPGSGNRARCRILSPPPTRERTDVLLASTISPSVAPSHDECNHAGQISALVASSTTSATQKPSKPMELTTPPDANAVHVTYQMLGCR